MKNIRNDEKRDTILNAQEFRDIFPESIYGLAELFSCVTGETLLRQSERSPYLFFLPEGRCKVSYLSANGKTIIVNQLSGPCLIGEMELFSEKDSFSVETMDDCILVGFPLQRCAAILKNDVRFLRYVCAAVTQKERDNVRRLMHSFSYPLKNRLARFILDYAEGNAFRIRKTTIAESLGVSYRHLETVMSGFVKEKILSKDRLLYRISDRKKLLYLAHELEDDLF